VAPFVYNSKWACGKNHMSSHPMRAMLKIYAIRRPLWSYVHVCQGSFKDLQGLFKWTHHHHFYGLPRFSLGILLRLTSMKTNFPTISPLGIDGNIVKQLCSPHILDFIPMIVLSSCLHAKAPYLHASSFTIFLSPFDINGKG
jgi:hypothetical protein